MVLQKKSFIRINTSLAACLLRTALIGTGLLICGNVIAQTTLVTVEGTVTDEQGAPLPGASVAFREIMTGFSRSAVTRADGYYRLSGLRSGEYEAEVSLDGFQTQIRKGMSFSVGAKLKIDYVLVAATLREEVIVVGEAPMVETTKSEVSTVVDRIKIDSLPLLDRDYRALTAFKAGTALEAGWNVRSNALPSGAEETLTDGVSSEHVQINDLRSLIPADAIKEFRVMTNQYEAEYGNASGMVSSAITRSGTDNFRGRLAFFTRFEGLDNPNYFVNHDGYQGPEIPKKEYEDSVRFKHDNWSGLLGGPLKKEKVHFFFIYEGTSHEEYTTVTSPLVPQETFPYQAPRTQILGKLDYQFSEKSNLAFRYTFDKPEVIDYVQGGLYTYTTGGSTRERTHDFQFNWTYYATDNAMNEMRLFYSDHWIGMHSIEDGKYDDEFFVVKPSGYFGYSANNPGELYTRRYQFVENLSLFAGDHNLKFGIDASYIQLGGFGYQMNPGYYVFLTDAPFDPNNFLTYPTFLWTTSKILEDDLPYWEVGIFAQDSWRVNDRLTLNYGLRYNYFTVHYLDYKTFDIRHFNPRLGFSFDPVGDGKTAIRGGIGTYSQNPQLNLGVLTDFNQLDIKHIVFPGYPAPSVPNPFIAATELPVQSYQGSPNMIYPYSMQATLGFQREFLTDLSIGFDLVYTRGYKFTRMENDNPIIPGTSFLREDMTKSDVWVFRPNGKSDYKALFVTLSKRYSKGWSLDLAYTLSRSWSDVETYMDWALSFEKNPWEEMWGPNNLDRTHRISLMGIFDLPADFQLSGTAYYMSSQPYSEFYAEDQNLDGRAADLLPSNPHRNFRRHFDYLAINLRLSWFLNFNRFRLQLIGEVYNATDRTNFYFLESFTREGDSFSYPTAAYDPRRFQSGIRLDF